MTLHRRSALLAVCIVAACTSTPAEDPLVAAYSAEDCPPCAEWNAPQGPVRVFGNTWYVGSHGLAALLITSDEGHVLIDGGLPDTAPLILANIVEAGFEVRDVRLILNSHPHYDHSGGIAALQRATGARVAALADGAKVLRTGLLGEDDPQHTIALPFPAVAEVELILDGETLRVGPLAVTAHRTAGHAPGGTSWTWQSCAEGRCLDLVYADSQTPVSAEAYRFSDAPDRVAAHRAGADVIAALPCDLLITPHPGASAFWERVERGREGLVDPQACQRYSETARGQLERRLAREAGGTP